jgi:hypothetical protein
MGDFVTANFNDVSESVKPGMDIRIGAKLLMNRDE